MQAEHGRRVGALCRGCVAQVSGTGPQPPHRLTDTCQNSASAVLAYIMSRHNKSLKEATDIVSKRRPCICPNNGFQKQLEIYEQELTAKSSDAP